MATEIQAQQTILPVHGELPSKINLFFDRAELIVERSERLITKSKLLFFSVLQLVHFGLDIALILALIKKD